MVINELKALKYDQNNQRYGEKLPWDLLPFKATEGMLRVLLYGERKYTTCGDCDSRIYENPKINGDPTRDDCPRCQSKNIVAGTHNWRKGFKWTRLIAASFRHLKSIAIKEDIDPDSGLPHVDHLMCMVAFLSEHQKLNYGKDDRFEGVM